jgi:hypothetical protein
LGRNLTGSILVLNPGEYFQGAVEGAVGTLKLHVSPHAQAYLAQLLGHFISTDNFYPTDASGRPAETLAHQLSLALEEHRAELRASRMRQLGDFSLYVAGFFTDSLSRKLVDIDYYIGMGGAAYASAAELDEKKARAYVLSELAKDFPKFVEILALISEETGFHPENHQDLLRTYDLWAKTGSERLAKQLARAGIVPANVKKPGEGSDS